MRHAGDYLVAFYSSRAEGRYGRDDGLRWREAATATELARGRDLHPHATPRGTEADVAHADARTR